MKRVWTKEMEEILAEAYPYRDKEDLLKLFALPYSNIKGKALRMGLLKAVGKRQEWTDEDIEILKNNYYDMPWADLLAKLPGKKISNVYHKAAKLGINRRNFTCFKKGSTIGEPYRFKKGQSPINKGKKQVDYMSQEAIERTAKNRFKKGDLPYNTKADYDISLRVNREKYPYLYIRISLGKWIPLHQWMWAQTHGPIEKGYIVVFKDGNQSNCVIENLELITLVENMQRNTIHKLLSKNPDLKGAFYANIALQSAITRQIKKQNKRVNQ